MTTFYVGKQPGDYAKLSDAVKLTRDGDTIFLRAGVYKDDPVTIDTDISLIGLGDKAHLQATKSISNGKGLIVSNADLYIKNLEFSGAKVGAHNGAGIRQQYGNLTVESSYFHDNENGILGHDSAKRTIIRNSEFDDNGYGDGKSHGIYITNSLYLEVTGSYFHDTDSGHLIKSRAAQTVIKDNILDDGKADTSYSIDLPEGGKVVIADNTIIQNVNGSNRAFISYTGEAVTYTANSLLIENNIFANYDAAGKTNNSVLLRNWRNATTAEISDNAFYRVSKAATGNANVENNKTLTSPPKVDFDKPGFVDASAPSDDEGGGTGGSDPVTETPGSDDGGSSGGGNGTGTATTGADSISGTSGKDTIDGGGGTDTISGLAGDDVLRGGANSDSLMGGTGNDMMYGDSQYDNLNGEDGNDQLFGGTFNDVLAGGNGNDSLAGNSGNDTLIGGAGQDTAIYAGDFADYNVKSTSVYAPSGNPDYGKDSLSEIEILKFADGIYVIATGVFTADAALADYN